MKTQHPIYEILAKEIAYMFDNPTFEKHINTFFHIQGYALDRNFNTASIVGFHAFGLRPIIAENSPVIVLCGTTKAINDIALNHPKGIGFNQFIKSQNEIATWLISVTQATHKKPDIVGHGLGGAIAQIVATEMIDWIGEVVTFSSPGINREIAAQFLQKGGSTLTVTHYIIDGDIISLAGEAFIAGKVIVQSFTNCVIASLYSIDNEQKVRRLLSNPPLNFTQNEISVDALNHPTFSFFSPEHLDVLAAYYVINPEIALCLTSREKFEALRQSGFYLTKAVINTETKVNFE